MKSFSIFLVCASLFMASVASAQSAELTRYVPQSSKVLIGLNFDQLRPSPIYAELFVFARQQPVVQTLFDFMETELGIKPEKDIDAVLLAFPEAVTNPAQAQSSRTLTVAVKGPFDPEKVIVAAKKRYATLQITGEGANAQFNTGEFSFALPAPGLLLLTTGKEDFQKQTWSALESDKAAASSDKEIGASLKDINPKRGLWMVGITRDLPQPGPKMNRAGLTLDVASGLKMDMVAEMATPEDATRAQKDFDDLKAQASNPMVMMLGAAPLVTNMKSKAAKTKVTLTTAMTKTEFNGMLKQLKQVVSQGSQPMKVQPATKAQPAPVNPDKKGVDADFN
jgi:hypothetical protein